jgi:hypothetical protein
MHNHNTQPTTKQEQSQPPPKMFFDDDLPVYGFVGKLEHSHAHGLKDGLAGEARVYLFTHFHFDIAYNGDQVSGGGGSLSLCVGFGGGGCCVVVGGGCLVG